MATTIEFIDADEILDSRGNPTLEVHVRLSDGTEAKAGVPSGASIGQFEAVELRDGDKARFGGKGVLGAAENVRESIGPAVLGKDPHHWPAIDRLMLELDGTENKSRLGANAIIGVSMAIVRVAAKASRLPLYAYLGGKEACRLPVPMINVINGGSHATNKLEFQEFMIVPHGAPSFQEAVRYAAETFHTLQHIARDLGYSTGLGDEGGLAPELARNEDACQLLVEAIERAGYKPGIQISLALDPAASSFCEDGGYSIPTIRAHPLSCDELLQVYGRWIEKFPIVSIEDGFGETDWDGFRMQTAAMGDRIQIVGDDVYVTNPKFLRKGIELSASNAALIKLNQIGTVSETIEAIQLCRSAGWSYIVSHRSGETTDPFIADFAVAMAGGQIKTGSVCRGERVAKYNRLLHIERDLGNRATFSSPFH